jgi:hypothetical protein
MDISRWVRVGDSHSADAWGAGSEAAKEALNASEPQLLLVFASFGYALPELLAGVAEIAGDVPVIGCSSAGEIGPGDATREPDAGQPDQQGDSRRRVVAVGLGGGGFRIRTGYATGLSQRPREVGEELGNALLPVAEDGHQVAVLLTDALAGDQQEMIRGVYGVLGATMPLVGGGAGDNMRMVTSRQFHRDTVLRDAVVAASIGSDAPLGIGIKHGWNRRGDTMVVTASEGNEVLAFDDRPALEVYLEMLGAPPQLAQDPAAFTDFALTHPLAVARRGDDAVRHVLAADPARRSLTCAGTVPKGAAVWVMDGDVDSTLAAARAACVEAVEGLGGADPLALLVFDCVGRRSVLGPHATARERAAMDACAGGAPVAGFYTFGEIARTRGVVGFHNQTIVTLALS